MAGAAIINRSPELSISDSLAQVPTWWRASISNSFPKPLGMGASREEQTSQGHRRAASRQLAGACL